MDLPNEILICEIFEGLDNPVDLFNVALVCKRWNAAVHSCYQWEAVSCKDGFKVMKNDTPFEQLLWASKNGKLKFIRWLHNKFHFKLADYYISSVSGPLLSPLSYASCNGHLNVVRWICTNFPLNRYDISIYDNEALRYACINNHLKVAQFLYYTFHLNPSNAGESERYTFYALYIEHHISDRKPKMIEWLKSVDLLKDQIYPPSSWLKKLLGIADS